MKRRREPPASTPLPGSFGQAGPVAWTGAFALLDVLRRSQGATLDSLGLGAAECRHSIVQAGRLWRLRAYDGSADGPPLLIVAAPIKRPYVWDLTPAVSAVRYCLARGLRVFLLEWLPATAGERDAGLADYAGRALEEAIRHVTRHADGARPVLAGHSLGGTFAAIHAALSGDTVAGLVLLAAPLCFAPGSGRFRDAVVSLLPAAAATGEVVPGSLLAQICAQASPEIFVWSRMLDAGLGLSDPGALALHARVERWALDELPLPARLVQEIFGLLYRDDRFCRSDLPLGGRLLGPAALSPPTLAVVNVDDGIAPLASIQPALEAMPPGRHQLLQHGGEIGVGLQHLAVLVGREAHASTWPRIADWMLERAD